MSDKPKRGRGRPWDPDRVKYVKADISLPPDLKALLKELGGSRWVQKKLEEEKARL